MRVEGRARVMDEGATAAVLALIRRTVENNLPPVIWDSMAAKDCHSSGA